MSNKKSLYLEIYNKANKNALNLLREAELLYDNKHYARAYFLAYTALEEISKSQFAADVFTGLCEEQSFKDFYHNHPAKLERIKWAHEDASSYPHNLKWIGPDQDDVERLDPQAPVFQKRQHALYIDLDFKELSTSDPEEKINEQDAKEIIHIVETALFRIWEVTGEFGGNQIGTKGFIK